MKALVGRMDSFSDDKEIFHGAYGYRWRKSFGFDQIEAVVRLLRKDPMTRRSVIQMWGAEKDLGGEGLDLPCNLSIAFRVLNNKLNMTVFNRSNDLIMGAYGANVVHMSILQEYIANLTGYCVGTYWQVSNNAHVYVKDYEAKWTLPEGESHKDPEDLYENNLVVPWPMIVNNQATFKEEAQDIVNLFCGQDLLRNCGGPTHYDNGFLENVCLPMARAYKAYKDGKPNDAAYFVNSMYSGTDWTLAGKRWLYRRGVEGISGQVVG
jgi:hypothetical protein